MRAMAFTMNQKKPPETASRPSVAANWATLGQVAATLGLLAVSGTLFYFMVKAMARIQMPTRRTD